MPLFVGRDFTIKAIHRAIKHYDRRIFMVAQRDFSAERVTVRRELFEVGTVAKISQILELPHHEGLKVLFEGLYRARFIPQGENDLKHGSRKVTSLAAVYPFEESSHSVSEHMSEALLLVWNAYAKKSKFSSQPFVQDSIAESTSFAYAAPGVLADAVIQYVTADYGEKQKILEIADGAERLEAVYSLIQHIGQSQ